MGVTAFGVVSGAAVVSMGDASAKHEPGTILAYRGVSDQWSLMQYVQNGNTVLNQGEVAVVNYATLKQYNITPAAAADQGGAPAGIAAATIGSLRFGWLYIKGYVEKADLSHTAASGEYLQISGSTAAKLTPNIASVFNAGTQGSSSMFLVCGVARTAIATGIGSITLVGCWGV
jgi:hypothetical protein